MTELEQVLAPKPRKSAAKSNKRWYGFTLTGNEVKVLDAELAKIGVNGAVADFVKTAVLNEVSKRQRKGKSAETAEAKV